MSDTKELIERLRDAAAALPGSRVAGRDGNVCDEAADTIARLEADLQNTRAEAALGMLAARREAMEDCARLLEAEHERSKHMHNYAACYARAIREAMEKP